MLTLLLCVLATVAVPPEAASRAAAQAEVVVALDLSANGDEAREELLVPADRRVPLEEGAARAARDLRPGDRVRMLSGGIGIVTSASPFAGSQARRNRVIGRVRRLTRDFLLLRTASELIETTPEHPFFVPGSGWTLAGHLKSGDKLATADSGRAVEIASIEHRHTRDARPVYNLTIEGSHVYHVGRDHLLVHNGNGPGGCPPEMGTVNTPPGEEEEMPATERAPVLPRARKFEDRMASLDGDFRCDIGKCGARAIVAAEFGFGEVLLLRQPTFGNGLYPATKYNGVREIVATPGLEPWRFHAVNVNFEPGGVTLHDLDQWIVVKGATLDEVAASYSKQMFPRQSVMYSLPGKPTDETTVLRDRNAPGALHWTDIP